MEIEEKVLVPSVFSNYSIFIPNVFIDKEKLIRAINDSGFNRREYNVESKREEGGHRNGDGGEFEEKAILKIDGRCMMISRHFCAYHIYSDDSEDFVVQDVRDTYVFGHDNLIRDIFSEIFSKLEGLSSYEKK